LWRANNDHVLAHRCCRSGPFHFINLVDSLNSKFSETLAGGGLQTEQRLIEVWRSADSGTFTIIMTRPDGISCVLAAGQNWHDSAAVPAGVSG
jgi:hypothetical protein